MADEQQDEKPSKDVATSNKGKEIEALGERGVEQQLPFATPFSESQTGTYRRADESLVELLRDESEDWGPTVRQLVSMRRQDGQATALYRLITMPILSALKTSTFVAEDDGDEEAEFIDMVFNTAPANGGMSTTFPNFMAQLLQGLFDGAAAFEKVFWVPTEGPLQGKFTLQKLAHRPIETISFIVDNKGGFGGLRQRAYEAGQVVDTFIEPQYSFYFAAQEEQRKFYGVSYFQAAFYHYDKKVRLYYAAHLAAQRAAVGTRIGTVPLNASLAAKREFAASMSNLAMAQWMMIPEGFKVEILKESGGYDFLAMINHHNASMSKSILASFFDKEQGAGQSEGSLVSFGQPGDDMFILMLRGIMDNIAAQINHYIIPQLIDKNFTGGKYPKFTWGKLTEEQKAAIAQTFDKLAGTAATSLSVTPEFMRALEEHMSEQMGLDIDYEEVEAREEDEAQEAAEFAESQNLAMGMDEFGAPLDPNAGQPQLTPEEEEEQELSAFEQKAVALSAEDQEKVDDLIALAGDFMRAAALDDDSELLLARTVQTQEGSKRFRQPIGSLIRNDSEGSGAQGNSEKGGVRSNRAQKRPMTLERLKSLKRQMEKAEDGSNTGLYDAARKEFIEGLRQYSAGREETKVLSDLKGALRRSEARVKKTPKTS